MAIADWKDKVRPTAAEVAEAQARDPGEGTVAALVRTASATVYTLAEAGVVLEVTQGTLTDRQYLDALWPAALAITDKLAPGTRAHMAAELLGLICTLFDHWETSAENENRPDVDMKGYQLSLAIGYRAGMLTLDEAGLFEVAGRALQAKKGRGDKVRERNLAKTAWYEDAKAKARRIRQTFPKRSAAQVAEAIHADASIPSPSYQQCYDKVLEWEKDGSIPRKRAASAA